MTPQETNDRIEAAFDDPQIIKTAFELGVADAARQYAYHGQLMVGWKNGGIVWIDPTTFSEVKTADIDHRD